MLRKEDFAVIKTLKQRGVYQKDIAAELGVHPRTVSRALKRDGAPRRERKRSSSKLEPYQPKIDQLLPEGVWNARVILREIQALGYKGGYTMLRAYIQPKRALRPGRATVRYETQPGQQLQSDWGEVMVEIGQSLQALSSQNEWQGRAHGGLCQRQLLCSLSFLRELGASEPARREVAGSHSRPAFLGTAQDVSCHHLELWDETLKVERRSLAAYEEVS